MRSNSHNSVPGTLPLLFLAGVELLLADLFTFFDVEEVGFLGELFSVARRGPVRMADV